VAKGPNPKEGKLFMDFLFGPVAGKAFAPFVGIGAAPGVTNVDLAKEFQQSHAKEAENEEVLARKAERWDDEELAERLVKLLKFRKEELHKILIIDEIDHFSRQEKQFMTLMKNVLKTDTNTSIIGIANSVDLPFRKTANAISLRDK
jgi:Cdc6-like AAA superfamily ATPase